MKMTSDQCHNRQGWLLTQETLHHGRRETSLFGRARITIVLPEEK